MNTLFFGSPLGRFSVLMHSDRAPLTCAYFRDLAASGALDDSSVFRVVARRNQRQDERCPIRIVQIGPARMNGREQQSIAHEGTNVTRLSHRQWTVSAARFDLGELYGSFFVCMRDEPELDFGGRRQPDGQGFAAFGRVVDGFETLRRMYDLAEDDEVLRTRIPVHTVAATNTA
ncbi:MAG: peptidylprolyl isomerase [Pseudomonadota bacterium]